jgi:hypothetical protein
MTVIDTRGPWGDDPESCRGCCPGCGGIRLWLDCGVRQGLCLDCRHFTEEDSTAYV